MRNPRLEIGVLGAGSWGTALAVHLARAGHAVRLWAREPEIVSGLRQAGRNPWYLADVSVPAGVSATGDPGEAAVRADIVIVAVPSEHVASVLGAVPGLAPDTVLVSATKGFEPRRHCRMSELLAERFPGAPVAVLSGPTFAMEVALGRPAAAVVACADTAVATRLQGALGTPGLRLYTNTDVVGVEVGGAAKNVIAIATGLADGLGLGESARAALVTRGLAEITRLAVALGGRAATLAGLAGLGDLVLTCTGSLSRNRALGVALAEGRTREALERETRMIAEGARTVTSALSLAARHGVSVPICAEVGAVLFEDKAPREAVATLLARAARPEDA